MKVTKTTVGGLTEELDSTIKNVKKKEVNE